MKVGVIVELLGKPLLEGIAEAARIGAEGIQIYGGHGGHGDPPLLLSLRAVRRPKAADGPRRRHGGRRGGAPIR